MTGVDAPIDLVLLREHTGGDDALIADLLQLLLETLPGQRDAIAAAMRDLDFVRISRTAHTLKGGAGSLAAQEVAAASAALEAAGRAHDPAAAAAAWEALDAAVERLLRWVEARAPAGSRP